MAKLIKGSELSAETAAAALAINGRRNTTTSYYGTVIYPKLVKQGLKPVALITDAEWLAKHAFTVNKNGTLNQKNLNVYPASAAE